MMRVVDHHAHVTVDGRVSNALTLGDAATIMEQGRATDHVEHLTIEVPPGTYDAMERIGLAEDSSADVTHIASLIVARYILDRLKDEFPQSSAGSRLETGEFIFAPDIRPGRSTPFPLNERIQVPRSSDQV